MKKCSPEPGKAAKLKAYDPVKWDFGHHIRNFRRVTDIHDMRQGLRDKITADFRDQFNTIFKGNKKENKEEFNKIMGFAKQFDRMTVEWSDTYLQRAMSKMERLEKAFDETCTLEKQLEEITNQRIVINMAIIYLENDLRKYTALQNFQYLMKDYEWRLKNDWIHRNELNELETFPESIKKRPKLFMRVRDSDNALLVKKFFFEHFVPIKRELCMPFTQTKEFLTIGKDIRDKTIYALLQLHLNMWAETKILEEFRKFEKTSLLILKDRKMDVQIQNDQNVFKQKRTKELKKITADEFDTNLKKSFKKRINTNLDAILDVVLCALLPNCEMSLQNFSAEDKVYYIENKVHELIEEIPIETRELHEASVRKQHVFKLRQAERAFAEEHRMNNMIKSLERTLEPPFQKLPIERPLPISRLPQKRKKRETPRPALTFQERVFIEAFTDETVAQMDVKSPENKKILKDAEDSCMPFYYDHFLKLRGYVPDTDFVTMIEQKDGKEEDLFKYKDVLPDVMLRLKQWQNVRKLVKKFNIAQTAHLYEDKRDSINES